MIIKLYKLSHSNSRMQKLILDKLAKYELFVIVGLVMTFLVIGKLLGVYDISSDWFWLIAAIGLTVEGIISLVKQKRFDNKYQIIERK